MSTHTHTHTHTQQFWPLSPPSAGMGRGRVLVMTDIMATSMRSTTETGRGRTLSLGWIGPGQKYIAVYFWLPQCQSPAAWHQIQGVQVMGEVYHRGISDSKWQHTHLDSCSQSYPAMSPRLLHIRVLHQTPGEYKGERDATLGCF